ncbi:hypothetical protein DQ04_11701000 [Trypanosoma grayi]|uniref:hypothetical protein n=1 Tax=Trypanosoma grayi TaxID=71804 RepID=UPI0004F40274|nr:hypothetical protein DQ04_11701000 [Trypanosoma grayi]KEG06902.1 hypothetical protein DQ04_11701000 [Trypanosoma grayi]
MTGKNGKILVSDLPMMYPSDCLRFEKEGGVWGQQWRVRRKQLTFALTAATLSTVVGSYYVVSRRNTGFVLFSTFSGFSVLGFCIGSALAPLAYPNVANNKETSMMRRVWWAKECAKYWDYSQVQEDTWKAEYPHAQIPQGGGR